MKTKKDTKRGRLGMKGRLFLSLGAIGLLLILSTFISLMEFRNMSSDVQYLIDRDLEIIEKAQLDTTVCAAPQDILLLASIHRDLASNATAFDDGLYRSIVPSVVALGVGIILLIMLMFFLLSNYARPIDKMLAGMKAYRQFGKKYNCRFDGDDQLSELNDSITELVSDNAELHLRIEALKKKQ